MGANETQATQRGHQPITSTPNVGNFTEEERMPELNADMLASLDDFTQSGRPESLARSEGAMIR
jgi:hypothetical protein